MQHRGLLRLRDEHGFCFGNVKRGDGSLCASPACVFERHSTASPASASQPFLLRLDRPRGTSSVAQRQDFQVRSCASTPSFPRAISAPTRQRSATGRKPRKALGYAHIEVPDHVFGATARDGWMPIYNEKDAFHETFVDDRLSRGGDQDASGSRAGVLISPQRQTGAHRQAGGRGRHPQRRTLQARHRRRLEPRRVRSARHGVEDARGAAGRAGRGDAPPVVGGSRRASAGGFTSSRRSAFCRRRCSARFRSGSADRRKPR